ncbi:unnamed protein product [Nezara viridula]|uniref:Spondin domain-containing protein n=1 Tax=Nezara viridula TaxID=85310 RepID=A0A9P0H0B2_NEZVI|nr:unnamed protein product [Nezara viridula]
MVIWETFTSSATRLPSTLKLALRPSPLVPSLPKQRSKHYGTLPFRVQDASASMVLFNACPLRIANRAAVVEQPDVWYQEDGPLTYTICEDLQEMSSEKQLTQCCACDEAKYEVSFEGLWSRQTHPKDFPEGENTRFSDVIGASHTSEYRDMRTMWSEGDLEEDRASSERTIYGRRSGREE